MDAESQKLRMLIEYSRDVQVHGTPEAGIDFISSAVRSVLGWEPEDLIGHNPDELVHPDDLAVVQEAEEAFDAGRSSRGVLRMRRKDGAYVWIESVRNAILNGNGDLAGLIASWRDVTDHVDADEALRYERARLKATLNSLLDPHITMTAVRDDEGQIVDFIYEDANQAALDYLGLDIDQFRGMRLTTMYPSEAAGYLRGRYAHTVETGEPLVEDDYAYPNEYFGGSELRYDLRGVKLDDGISITWRDVTERVAMINGLAESEAHFRLLAENASDVVMLIADGVVTWISPSLTEQLGWAPDDWLGKEAREYVHPEDLAGAEHSQRVVLAGSRDVRRARLRDSSGAYHWVEGHVGPHRDDTGTISGMRASFRVVDQEVHLEQERDRLARTDPVTGLLNRREALAQVLELTSHAPRTGRHFAILFCDIDHFKSVNDAYGHGAGDEVLRIIAERTTKNVRSNDRVARIGGDEFLIVLAGVHNLDQAVGVAEKIRAAVDEPITFDGAALHATVSIGVALAHPGETVDEMMARSDAAMYEAKSAGRNRVSSVA